jgi:hypothetical protein
MTQDFKELKAFIKDRRKIMLHLTCKRHSKGWQHWSAEVENDWNLVEKTIGEHMVKSASLSIGNVSIYKGVCEVQVEKG